jgi:hypothetical protein
MKCLLDYAHGHNPWSRERNLHLVLVRMTKFHEKDLWIILEYSRSRELKSYSSSKIEKIQTPGGQQTLLRWGTAPEELLNWVRAMDKYFDYEDVDEEKRVRHAVTIIKGHETLWWDELQDERKRKGKQKIKNWDRMVAKLKAKFMPKDYQINLFRKL